MRVRRKEVSRGLVLALVLAFGQQGCINAEDDVEEFADDNGAAIGEEILEDAANAIDDEVDLMREEEEIDKWYGDPDTIGPRPPTDDEDAGGCLELSAELDCEPIPGLEEFCFEPSEEEVELLYEATRLLQQAFEAEARGDYCLALERLDKLAGMVPEESIISNLLTIRLMAEIQDDWETLQTAEALLQHLGYDVVGLGVFFFDSPIEPEPPPSVQL